MGQLVSRLQLYDLQKDQEPGQKSAEAYQKDLAEKLSVTQASVAELNALEEQSYNELNYLQSSGTLNDAVLRSKKARIERIKTVKVELLKELRDRYIDVHYKADNDRKLLADLEAQNIYLGDTKKVADKNLKVLEGENMRRKRMAEIANYERERVYNTQIMVKYLVYHLLAIILIKAFHKFYGMIIPDILFTVVYVLLLIHFIFRVGNMMMENLSRSDRVWYKYTQDWTPPKDGVTTGTSKYDHNKKAWDKLWGGLDNECAKQLKNKVQEQGLDALNYEGEGFRNPQNNINFSSINEITNSMNVQGPVIPSNYSNIPGSII